MNFQIIISYFFLLKERFGPRDKFTHIRIIFLGQLIKMIEREKDKKKKTTIFLEKLEKIVEKAIQFRTQLDVCGEKVCVMTQWSCDKSKSSNLKKMSKAHFQQALEGIALHSQGCWIVFRTALEVQVTPYGQIQT
jgi:hypothetical protein